MKNTVKVLALVAALFASVSVNAQITTTAVVQKVEPVKVYDSLTNFLGKDMNLYIGQELYLLGKSESLRKYGYEGFVTDTTKSIYNDGVTYKSIKGTTYRSEYDSLAGKYFKVVSAVNKGYLKSYLILEEKNSGDKVYFKYNTDYEHAFPFLVVGFFEKQKKLLVGNKFVTKQNSMDGADIKTGLPITYTLNQRWECVDLTIEEKYYNLALVLKNSKGEITTLAHASLTNNYKEVFTEKEAIVNEKKFGLENWNRILKGNIKVGFTEEMAILSWGTPDRINRASYGDQWVYGSQYLYFKNKLLSSFN